MPHFFTVGVRKFALLLGAVFMVMLLTACSRSPEGVTKAYFKAVADNRIDEAIGYYSLDRLKGGDNKKIQTMLADQHSKMQKKGGLASISTALVGQKDAFARVSYELKFKNGETDRGAFDLAKESGQWKIQ